MRETNLTLPNEIYRRVANELGLTERQVKYVYDSYIAELTEIANYTDATSIRLPHIGVMYINKKFVESEIKYLENSGKDPEKLKAFKKKKKVLDIEIKDYGNKASLKQRCLHLKRPRLANTHFTAGKTLSEIEDIQNADFSENN